MLLTALVGLALAEPTAPDAATLQAHLQGLRPTIEAHGVLPLPELSEADWATVASGKVVKRRVRLAGEVDRAVGVAWLPSSADRLWVSIIDDVHDDMVSGLSEVWLPGTVPGHKELYQHLAFPGPVADRHWVIVIENTRPLHAASEGRVWERTWNLHPRGTAALVDVPGGPIAKGGEAVWTPVNEGGWLVTPVGEGALVVYQVRGDVGGFIPDEFILRYAMSTLDELVTHVGEVAAKVPEHYGADHYLIYRPDGSPIEPWPRD